MKKKDGMNWFSRLRDALAHFGVKDVHPACEALPVLRSWEFESLKDSLEAEVEKGGPITVAVDSIGSLVDGRHRLLIAYEQKWSVEKVIVNTDPWEYVFREHLPRRQLSTGQRAMVALKVFELFNQAQGGRPSEVRNFAHLEGRITEKIGSTVGVSARTVEKARKVKRFSDELAGKVFSGEVSLEDALRRMDGHEPNNKAKGRRNQRKLGERVVPDDEGRLDKDDDITSSPDNCENAAGKSEVSQPVEEVATKLFDHSEAFDTTYQPQLHEPALDLGPDLTDATDKFQSLIDWFRLQDPDVQRAVLTMLNRFADPLGRIVAPDMALSS